MNKAKGTKLVFCMSRFIIELYDNETKTDRENSRKETDRRTPAVSDVERDTVRISFVELPWKIPRCEIINHKLHAITSLSMALGAADKHTCHSIRWQSK